MCIQGLTDLDEAACDMRGDCPCGSSSWVPGPNSKDCQGGPFILLIKFNNYFKKCTDDLPLCTTRKVIIQ